MSPSSPPQDDDSWIMVAPLVQSGRTWEVVGPFPSGMREHPLTGSPIAAWPSDPSIDPDFDFATRPYDTEETFPSAMGDGGRVGWSRVDADADGHVRVSYPDINWDDLRRDHGWAAVQFQCVLRTDLIVPDLGDDWTSLRVDLSQGTEYAIIPTRGDGKTPTTWYQGDVYDFGSSPSGSRGTTPGGPSNFSRSIALAPGSYRFLVRAMYEIRMFGDPGPGKAPTIDMHLRVHVDDAEEPVEVVEGLRVVPDMVDGWMMGEYLSVPIRVTPGRFSWSLASIIEARGKVDGTDIEIELAERDVAIRAGQIRPIAFRIKQSRPAKLGSALLHLTFDIEYNDQMLQLIWEHAILPKRLSGREPFLITVASPTLLALAGSEAGFEVSHQRPSYAEDPFGTLVGEVTESRHMAQVTNATVVPPSRGLHDSERLPPVLLGLHGAGVDVESPFWAEALPDVPGMWAVLPSGKNEWGEDWHGASASDVFAARAAFPNVVKRLNIEVSERTILVGHSNGGQGAWHLAARYPDAFVGVIAASGWLKIQDYVPYIHSISNHYADPMLTGILHTALTPYNNDLYASNLTNLPILAVHGSDDDNVPARHSRQHVALVQAWKRDCKDRMLVEVPKKGHWWDDVLKSPEVYEFIDNLIRGDVRDWAEDRERGFTLTTANPDESHGRSGIRILELRIPGRLARLDVKERAGKLEIRGTNVRQISYQTTPADSQIPVDLDEHEPGFIPLPVRGPVGRYPSRMADPPRRYGPMIRLLDTAGPISIIVDPSHERCYSIAMRYAHDLYVYHRIAVNILSDSEALRGGLKDGNIVALGRPDQNGFVDRFLHKRVLYKEGVPLKFHSPDEISFDGQILDEEGAGLITLLRHPFEENGLVVLLAANDDEGLELASRLLPLRTGVPVPEWAIVSPRTRWQAAGGLIGAGWYDHEWLYGREMSWMDRGVQGESAPFDYW